MAFSIISSLLYLLQFQVSRGAPTKRQESCRKTQVVVLGGGVAGITAAQTLVNASIEDFLIVEYRNDLGGRVAHTTFGSQADGTPYIVELGANWVQGLQSEVGPENPIWRLAQKYEIQNTYSDLEDLQTFTDQGAVDYIDLLAELDTAYTTLEQNAGVILNDGLLDYSVRTGLSLAGWKPMKDPKSNALEWFYFDWEYSHPPELSSALFSIVNYNTTFYQYSEENNLVFDPRGFNYVFKGEAAEFLNCTEDFDCSGDPRLLLDTVVMDVAYNDDGVWVTNEDSTCIEAEYAISTFSLGVLKNEAVNFVPPFPDWKRSSIEAFQMGTYTKIFLQFPPDQVFWNTSVEFFLYADPLTRGYYPAFQSLDGEGFLPGSGILFVTVVEEQSYTVEAQDEETTKEQILKVLRDMYGAENVPAPTAFMYPRWSLERWTFGSYSNWPVGVPLEQHQNLRANLGRLYFAGEATSSEYFGFLQGAYFEGQHAGQAVADCLLQNGNCPGYTRYEVLHGITQPEEYNATNGWDVTSFQTNGLDDQEPSGS